MRAIRYDRYGPPAEVLEVREVEAPTPREGEVLVRVRAAGANPVEWHLVRGEPFLIRLMNGLRRPKDGDVGLDVAGVIEEIGPGVTDLRPGDEVFGHGSGSFAELTRAKASRLARKPERLSFEQAASVPVAGGTAFHALVTHGRVEVGERVLIVGAGGGVGSFAVQLAKALGAEVTAVCSGEKTDYVRALGADRVVDYTREDVTALPERYDVVIQLAGDHSLFALRRLLSPHGRLVLAGSGAGRDGTGFVLGALRGFVLSLLFTRFTDRAVKMFVSSTSRENLETLVGFVERGELTPSVEHAYPLEQAADALTEIESGHTRGKLVVAVG
ncbi:MAG TPA: NAD(P)-dependent alcohol dehydrogenase [Gaiellaceae bacterium]|nr:NAD(P)-dependent alcohol dehydrogenase [Gaiellaceae bacterium]